MVLAGPFFFPYNRFMSSGSERPAGGRVGITLMELILAIFLLSIVVVFITTTFLSLLGATSKSQDITIARQIIQRRLGDLCSNSDHLRHVARVAVAEGLYDDDPVLCEFPDSANDTVYLVNIRVRDMLSAVDKSLYLVDVEVSWWDPQRKMRQGYGKLTSRGSRALYLRR